MGGGGCRVHGTLPPPYNRNSLRTKFMSFCKRDRFMFEDIPLTIHRSSCRNTSNHLGHSWYLVDDATSVIRSLISTLCFLNLLGSRTLLFERGSHNHVLLQLLQRLLCRSYVVRRCFTSWFSGTNFAAISSLCESLPSRSEKACGTLKSVLERILTRPSVVLLRLFGRQCRPRPNQSFAPRKCKPVECFRDLQQTRKARHLELS